MTIFIELITAVFMAYLMWVVHKQVTPAVVIESNKIKYLGLYELYKVGKQLEKRGLSFAKLEEFSKQFEQKRKNNTAIEVLDKQYSEKKEEK
jgi:hypothetical protein